ncbi:MAG TPA: WD40 repeat domain-containing protein, partial [Pirellulaceae bacterium]
DRILTLEATTTDLRGARVLSGLRHMQPLAFARGGQHVVLFQRGFGASNHTLHVCNLSTRKHMRIGEWTREPIAVALTDQADWVAIAFRGRAEIEIRVAPNFELVARLEGHLDPVERICLSPDELFLVSGDQGGCVRVWDTLTHRTVATPSRFGGPVRGLVVSADGSTFAAALDNAPQPGLYVWNTTELLADDFESEIGAISGLDSEPILDDLGTADGVAALGWFLRHPIAARSALDAEFRAATVAWDATSITTVVAALGSPDFDQRSQAYETLRSRREGLRDQLEFARRECHCLETALSIERLLRDDPIDEPLAGSAYRRMRRLVYLLERQPATDALSYLRVLTATHPDARIRSAATSAAQRREWFP